jgi:modulator of FtsH protease
MAYAVEAWHDFFVAVLGASAVLTGLVFVALSINLKEILSEPSLPSRAAEAITVLFSVLVFSVFGLVPSESSTLLGIGLLATGLVAWGMTVAIQIRSLRRWPDAPHYGVRIATKQAATLPVIIAGISVLAVAGGGLYWLIPATLLLFIAGVLDAWVLLVEILR